MNKPAEKILAKFPPWIFGMAAREAMHLAWVGALLSVLLVWTAAWQQRHTVLDEMEQKSVLLGQSLAGACGLPYLLGDLSTVEYILSQAQNIQDVQSVALLNRNGGVDVQRGEKMAISVGLVSETLRVWKGDLSMHVAVPVHIQRRNSVDVADLLSEGAQAPSAGAGEKFFLGVIYLKLSLDRAESLVRGLIFKSVLATIAIVLLGSGVGFLFFRRNILRPIHRLIDAMATVRRGNLSVRLEKVDARNEIGVLARSFNDMLGEIHAAKEALVQANEALEDRVMERTADLQKALQQLKETQEKVLRSEKLAAIGQLASGVGHELRNPLGAIQNAVYYVKDSLKESVALKEDPTLGEFLTLAENEIKSATRIISDLLDFSRVVKLQPESTDLNGLLRDMKNVLSRPENIEYIEMFQEDLPRMLIDPQKMRQVFINLATNAFQAMGEGGVLRVKTAMAQAPGSDQRWVRVDFEDQGPGIPPEVLAKLFEPLFTTKAKGTGLGLAISQGIVEKHGGKIHVSTVIKKGTTFSVQFPFVPAAAPV